MVGPASMISQFIVGAARNAVDDLAERVRTPVRCCEDEVRLRAALAASNAWLETYIDCEAIEWYTFDPPCDPADPII